MSRTAALPEEPRCGDRVALISRGTTAGLEGQRGFRIQHARGAGAGGEKV